MWERKRGARTTLAMVILATVVLAGCDWNQLGFGPGGTNFNPSEPALTAASVAHLTSRWSAPCACSASRPLYSGGTVYVVDGYKGEAPYALSLRAFDAADGRPKWSTPLGPSGFGGTLAAVANGLVYLTVRPVQGSDRLVAIDAATGVLRWQVTPPTPGTGRVRLDHPVVDGALAFVAATASDASEVSAIDAAGHRAWSVVPGGQVFEDSNVATVPGQTLYVASAIVLSNGQGLSLLTGYSLPNGTKQSTAVIPEALPVQSIAAANGLVYGTWFTAFGRLSSTGAFAVDPQSGAVAWSGDLFGLAVTPTVALTNNPRSGTLTARDPSTGATRWSTLQGDAAAAVTDQVVFFSRGDIRRLSDGALVGKVPSSEADPLVRTTPTDGRVLAVSMTTLFAFSPSTP